MLSIAYLLLHHHECHLFSNWNYSLYEPKIQFLSGALGVVQIIIMSELWERGGQRPLYGFFKCRLWCTVILRRDKKSIFSQYSFVREGGHKKEYCVIS